MCKVLWPVDGSFVSYKGIEGGFEVPWNLRCEIGRGMRGLSAAWSQGCVEPWRGFEDPNLPLSIPNGVQLAPTSPKLVVCSYCELHCLVRLLRSSA